MNGSPVFPAHLLDRLFSSFDAFAPLVKDHIAECAWGCFCVFYSVPLVHTFALCTECEGLIKMYFSLLVFAALEWKNASGDFGIIIVPCLPGWYRDLEVLGVLLKQVCYTSRG